MTVNGNCLEQHFVKLCVLFSDFLQPVTVAPKAYVGYIMFKQFGNLLPDRFGADVRWVISVPSGRNLLVDTSVLVVKTLITC